MTDALTTWAEVIFRESKYLDNVFSKKDYNPDFVKRNVYKNNEPNTTNAKPVTTATIPYIKGTSETIARILQPYNIRVAHKPITTLRQLLTNVKDKDEPNDRQGAVYKIKCCDCQASYIGETGRKLIWTYDWLNTNGRRKMVMSTITLLNTIYTRITELTGTLLNALPTVQTTTNDSL